MTTAARTFENLAITLAASGYHVFPCRPRGKAPLTGHGFKDATRDERQLLAWWDSHPGANPAVACGASGMNVLDIDSKHGADPREVIDQLGLERHPIILTGEAPDRSQRYPDSLPGVRGAQVWFRGDRRTCATRIEGVELRGVGGYVLAPGAIHPSGVRYEGELPAAAELPELPENVLAILPRPTGAGQRTPTSEWLVLLRVGVPQGSRHHQLARITGHLLRRYVDPDLVLELVQMLNASRCRPALPETEVHHIVEMICAAELRRRQEARL